jgi:hypothetical protein
MDAIMLTYADSHIFSLSGSLVRQSVVLQVPELYFYYLS